jgi:ketosteroid isomerase-like protein
MVQQDSGDLLERLRRIEDQLAIYQVISAYGPAVDTCDMERLASTCAADATYQLADLGTAQGWDAISALFDAPMHRGLVEGGCAHIASLPHVFLEGDRAVAVHYTQLMAHQADGSFRCVRLSAHRWELARQPQGWVMQRRQTALLDGSQLARDLLKVPVSEKE